MTRIYFAVNYPLGAEILRDVARTEPDLHVLLSFAYVPTVFPNRDHKALGAASLMLDSGAFTAWRSGSKIDLEALIAEIQTGDWDIAVALDDIECPKVSLANALAMKARGLNVMPVFHIGEPFELLDDYCAAFSCVGISSSGIRKSRNDAVRFTHKCFSRRWPHAFHSFGWVDEGMMLEVPFWSADATSWYMRRGMFGLAHLPGYVGKIRERQVKKGEVNSDNLIASRRQSILAFLDRQRRLVQRWKKELSRFDPRDLHPLKGSEQHGFPQQTEGNSGEEVQNARPADLSTAS